MNLPSQRSRWIFSAIAVGLLYLNGAVIWQHLAARWQARTLPVPKKIAGALSMFGVFVNYETNNNELVLWGYFPGLAPEGTNGWKPLPIQEYFPFKPGVRQQLLGAKKFARRYDLDRLARAWVRCGEQVLALHNRLHPEIPISQLAWESRTWPRSPAGVYALQQPGALQTNFWIVVTNR